MSWHVRELSRPDVPTAASLLERAYGRPGPWATELTLYLDLQPGGTVTAVEDGRLLGVGGTIDYGPFGWIGLMGVDPDRQGAGIGRAILTAVLAYLDRRNCPVRVLDASAAGAPLYVAAGFHDLGMTVLFQRNGDIPPAAPVDGTVSRLQPSDLADVAAFDRPIFGADRSRLLAWLLRRPENDAFLIRGSTGAVAGFIYVQPDRIGPWVARDEAGAERLLIAALHSNVAQPAAVRIPDSNLAAMTLVQHHGFERQRALRHMYLGLCPADQSLPYIYSESSFGTG